jgi:hypothetical protein
MRRSHVFPPIIREGDDTGISREDASDVRDTDRES